jgi:NADH-quinone oxidoreductase subunit G
MELLLINHPLDCTVCDQAGHCKLQDYHYEYNARPSRFLENKEKKPKAVPLGETVMLDAERCIACTRCVRFCDEITETGEIGLLNRGDRYTIAVKEGRELANPLSGTVVDLCPVGALTHRNWRFNTRIWYANPTDSICTGCSTGCNVRVYERDGQVVQVKARLHDDVNKEWLCDEGRYGFHRFLPEERVRVPMVGGEDCFA